MNTGQIDRVLSYSQEQHKEGLWKSLLRCHQFLKLKRNEHTEAGIEEVDQEVALQIEVKAGTVQRVKIWILSPV